MTFVSHCTCTAPTSASRMTDVDAISLYQPDLHNEIPPTHALLEATHAEGISSVGTVCY